MIYSWNAHVTISYWHVQNHILSSFRHQHAPMFWPTVHISSTTQYLITRKWSIQCNDRLESSYHANEISQFHLTAIQQKHQDTLTVFNQINEVTLHRARLVLEWVTVSEFNSPVQEIYISLTNRPSQPSLAIPPLVGAMSTGQRAVMLCGRGEKADIMLLQVTLCDPYLSTLEAFA